MIYLKRLSWLIKIHESRKENGMTMLPKDKIDRINELSKKSKSEGLTTKEQEEQQSLRQQYLQAFRSSMKNTLKGVTVVDPNGNDVTPQKLKDEKKFNLQ
jgi:uncharacterized protein YnzC (UPF0291/DUF896 family)